jgi:hypothetical protein
MTQPGGPRAFSVPGFQRLHDIGAADYAAAVSDLEATHVQAVVLVATAFAWRLTPVLLVIAILGSAVSLIAGLDVGLAVLWPALAVLGPQLLAFVCTFPVGFVAGAQTFYRGSRDAHIRFGTTPLVYNYYGWRYAFRGRRRPWGALTPEEKQRDNPRRYTGD